MAAQGAHVCLFDIDLAAGEAASAQIQRAGGSAEAMLCDVTNEEQFRTAIAGFTARHGGVDILINNAGLHSMEYNQPIANLGIGKIRRAALALPWRKPWRGRQHWSPAMIEQAFICVAVPADLRERYKAACLELGMSMGDQAALLFRSWVDPPRTRRVLGPA